MLVNEIMSAVVVSVSPEASVKDVIGLLAQHGITSIPVIDGRGELVGIISEADVLRDSFLPAPHTLEKPVFISSGPSVTRAGDVMSHQVLTVPAHADLIEAAELMVGTAVKSLPVIENNRVVGMLSRRDLVSLLARRDGDIEAAIDELVRTAGYDWTSDVVDGVVTVEGPVGDREIEVAKVLVATVPGVVGLYVPGQRTSL